MPDPIENRSPRAFWVAVAAVLTLVPIGYALFLYRPAPGKTEALSDSDPRAPVNQDGALFRIEDLQIADVTGAVEIREGTSAWAPARIGTSLRADNALRTLDGRARLSAREWFDVHVEPGTEVEIQELTRRLSRFRLGLGLLVVRVEGKAGRRLEVATVGSDAVVGTRGGTFAVSSNGEGTVAVGAREGEVELRNAGQAVILKTGQQAVAQAGLPPLTSADIPSSLFLKIDSPTEKEVNRLEVEVAGRTAPGATAIVSGQPVRVKRNGHFRTWVRVHEGKNDLVVESRDVGDHHAVIHHEITVDTTGPDPEIATQKLWDRPDAALVP